LAAIRLFGFSAAECVDHHERLRPSSADQKAHHPAGENRHGRSPEQQASELDKIGRDCGHGQQSCAKVVDWP
jgi:hypothetical protein